MRILVVTQHFYPSVGGAEVMLDRLAAAWTQSGHQLTVLTGHWSNDWPRSEARNGYRIVRHPVVRVRFLGTVHYASFLGAWIKNHRREFDVAYVSMLKHAAFATVDAGNRVGLPVVLRAEGPGPTGDVEWPKRSVGGNWVRLRCQLARAIVAPSDEIRTELVAAGYASDRIHLIPNGVPIPQEPWQPSATMEYRKQLGLPERPTIVCTGRLHPDKGLADLPTPSPCDQTPIQSKLHWSAMARCERHW